MIFDFDFCLRARKPSAQEKEALNIAFLLTPVVSVAMPVITKDVVTIWWANAAAVAATYIYAYLKPANEDSASEGNDTHDDGSEGKAPSLLIKAFKALDYGSGQERGARK